MGTHKRETKAFVNNYIESYMNILSTLFKTIDFLDPRY